MYIFSYKYDRNCTPVLNVTSILNKAHNILSQSYIDNMLMVVSHKLIQLNNVAMQTQSVATLTNELAVTKPGLAQRDK